MIDWEMFQGAVAECPTLDELLAGAETQSELNLIESMRHVFAIYGVLLDIAKNQQAEIEELRNEINC